MKHTVILRDAPFDDINNVYIIIDGKYLEEEGEATYGCLQEILDQLNVNVEVLTDDEEPYGKEHVVLLHDVYIDSTWDYKVEIFVDGEMVVDDGYYTEDCLEEVIAKLGIDAEIIYENEIEITTRTIERRERNKY